LLRDTFRAGKVKLLWPPQKNSPLPPLENALVGRGEDPLVKRLNREYREQDHRMF
jgi:hypothetical protein